MQAAAQAAFDMTPKRPDTVQLLAFGGRKHDALVLHEVLRRQAQAAGVPLRSVSVDRRPFVLRVSDIKDGGLSYQTKPFAELLREQRVGLDEVLGVHGFQRTKGVRILDNGPISEPPANGRHGDPFEWRVCALVRQPVPKGLRGMLNELWWGAEIMALGKSQIATEFDVFLLACDAGVVHFECKVGGTGGAQSLQYKVFQMRRAFTPESSLVLCRKVNCGETLDQYSNRIRNLGNQYEGFGSFDLLVRPHKMGH